MYKVLIIIALRLRNVLGIPKFADQEWSLTLSIYNGLHLKLKMPYTFVSMHISISYLYKLYFCIVH